MKVGTDGVLLGVWCSLEGCRSVLDIGTGTGLIALMAAQRCQARITAVEIDPEAATQAKENILSSPWADRIDFVYADIRTWQPDTQYDAILCNPPFYDSTLPCPDKARNTARHSTELSYGELAATASRLLSDAGMLQVVIPAQMLDKFRRECESRGLHALRITHIQTVRGKAPGRVTAAFGRREGTLVTDTLALTEQDGSRTAEYNSLAGAFYL
ncbi:MAG: methyltransferase [Bacteroidales bacterium]|nr:methyltransferase [Bacteroidales bacterium]